MRIENDVATIEHVADDYRIVVVIERQDGAALSREEAEAELTRTLPLLFNQRVKYPS